MKPVAWMHKENHKIVVFNHIPENNWWIPLYTAPRELSDEEILEIYESIWEGDLTIEEINNSDIRFARAILKRASEDKQTTFEYKTYGWYRDESGDAKIGVIPKESEWEMNTADVFGYILVVMYGLAVLLLGYKIGKKEGERNKWKIMTQMTL